MGVKFAGEKRFMLERCMHEICTGIGSLDVSLGRFRGHAASITILEVCGRYANTWYRYVLGFGERQETTTRHVRRANVDFVA